MKHSRDGLEFYTVPVVEYIDLPEDIREELKAYYTGTNHREILNDTYVRFPYLFDFDDDENILLEKWFVEKLGDSTTEFIIIHFDW